MVKWTVSDLEQTGIENIADEGRAVGRQVADRDVRVPPALNLGYDYD